MKGVAHAAYSAVSSRHWNVALTSGDVKVKAGVLSAVAPEGPPVIVVCGASVSTTKLPARRCRVRVADRVDGAHLEGVRAVGQG